MTPFPNHICFADQYGMKGDYLTAGASYTDNTPAWNAIMTQATAGDTIVLPPGYGGFKSQPMPFPDFVKVQGAGAVSALVRCHAPKSGEEIFIRPGVQWATLEDVQIFSADGFTGGVGVGRVASNANDCAYKTTLRNVHVTTFNTGKWLGGCKFSGEFGAPHYGTRMHVLDDVQFRASSYGLQLVGAGAVEVSKIIVPEASWAIWLISTTNNPTNNCQFSGRLEGNILSQGAITSLFDHAVVNSVNIDNNSSGITVRAAYLNNTPVVNGTNNHVTANGNTWNSLV